ncbi:MAG: DeoR/GlpR transcriptional regulator [Sinomicrobium sp.]|nr:DeoR/GlpR transcriptional regulator [Sinomicrobium sp.]
MKGINERQMQIIADLNESGFVKGVDLCKKFGVSAVTIRKDLTYLEKKGLLFRTHGGASKQSLYAFERNVAEKENLYVEQKKKIAAEAIKFIQNKDYLILASGTTIHYLARMLSNFDQLTVLTSSLYVAVELCKNPAVDIVQLGGAVRKSSKSVTGPITEQVLNEFSCNTLFLGVDGIDLAFGLTTSNEAEAHLNKVMIARVEKVIVLADSSKIGKRSFWKIADAEAVDVLITDGGISEKHKALFEDRGVEVVIARDEII